MIKTTVVIPNFNGMKFLEECLASLAKQTCKEMEVILVDNGSTDGSVTWIQSNYPQIKVISYPENKGFCKAVNAGMKAANSEYLILLNNDTTVCEDFIEQLLKSMEQHPKCFSASAKMVEMQKPAIMDGAGDYYCALGWAYARGKGKPETLFNQEKLIFAACGGAAIYRKKVLEEIGYFDENHFAYLEDMDIGYRAKIFGYQNRYAPKAVVRHAGSGFSGSRYNKFKIELSSKNSIYLIYKNMPLLQIVINLPFLMVGFLIKALFFARKGFGHIYLSGLWRGICFSFSKEAQKHKVTFQTKNLKNYLHIQMELWVNMVRRFVG